MVRTPTRMVCGGGGVKSFAEFLLGTAEASSTARAAMKARRDWVRTATALRRAVRWLRLRRLSRRPGHGHEGGEELAVYRREAWRLRSRRRGLRENACMARCRSLRAQWREKSPGRWLRPCHATPTGACLREFRRHPAGCCDARVRDRRERGAAEKFSSRRRFRQARWTENLAAEDR